MALDPTKNFAISTIATAPSPAASGTTFVVATGDGAKFPAPSTDGAFNVIIFPEGEQPDASNAEIVRVTGRSTDTFTITRTQEGTSARTIGIGDVVMLGLTDKMIDDINTDLVRLKDTSGANTGDQVVPANTTATADQYFTAYNSTTGAFTKSPVGHIEATVRNETGSTIAIGKVVYASGFNNIPLVALCDNTVLAKTRILGITKAAINDQANGQVIVIGTLSGLNTNSFNVGDALYLSTAGGYVNTVPTSGVVQEIGFVRVKSDTTGEIEFKPDHSHRYKATPASEDMIIRMGDTAGTNKVSFRDYGNTEVASVNSDGMMLGERLVASGANGAITLNAITDGGDFNLYHETGAAKTLAIFGSSGGTMNVDLLDGGLTVAGTTTLNGNIAGTGIADEDDMASNSAVKVPTQQSVKAYVDASKFTNKGDWTTSTTYATNDLVAFSGSGYVCNSPHTSGTFSTDLAAGRWTMYVQGYSLATILGSVYPVGAIYTSVVSTSPQTLFGFGTWVAFGAGKMMVGLDSGDTNFDTVEETGGAKTVTIGQANLPNISTGAGSAHKHTQDAHYHTVDPASTTTSSDGAHTHSNYRVAAFYGGTGTGLNDAASGTEVTAMASAGSHTHTVDIASFNSGSTTATNQNESSHTHSLGGSGTALSVMNPYIVVYMWKRTA